MSRLITGLRKRNPKVKVHGNALRSTAPCKRPLNRRKWEKPDRHRHQHGCTDTGRARAFPVRGKRGRRIRTTAERSPSTTQTPCLPLRAIEISFIVRSSVVVRFHVCSSRAKRCIVASLGRRLRDVNQIVVGCNENSDDSVQINFLLFRCEALVVSKSIRRATRRILMTLTTADSDENFSVK